MTAHISVGVHQCTTLLLPMLNTIQPTMEWSTSVQTYSLTPMQELLTQELLEMTIQKVISDPSSMKTMAETPAIMIPPKPPDSLAIITERVQNLPLVFKPLDHVNHEQDILWKVPAQ